MLAIVVLSLLWRAWTVARWTWQDDDWIYMHDAHAMPLWDYLVQDYNGHLMPGGFLVTWVVTTLAPLNFWVPVVVVALTSAGVVLVWAVALARLAGPRLLTLAPLALVALSPLYLRPTMWWAAATQALPMLVFMGLCVIGAERWTRSHARADLLRLLVAYAGGLFFWEKAVLLVLPVCAVLLMADGRTLRARLRTARTPLVALAGVTLVYLPIFLVATSGESANSIEFNAAATQDGAVEFLARGFSEMLAPALLGGPWGTLPVSGDIYGHPSLGQSVLLGVLLVALATLAALRWPGSWTAIAAAGLYAVVAWGMILFSNRFILTGQHAVTDERFSADVLAAAVVSLALVMRAARRDGPRRRSAVTTRGGRRALAPVLVGVLGGSLLVSNLLATDRIGTNPGRAWVENLRADLAARGAPTVLWDANTPDTVLQPAFFPAEARLSYVLAPYGDDVRFSEPARQLAIVDPRGRVHDVEVTDESHAEAGPVEGCGYALGPGDRVTVPMSDERYLWDWALQVNTVASTGGTMAVTVGGTTTVMQVRPGLEQLQVQLQTAVPETITLEMADDAGTVCVSEVIIGNPQPAAG
ncbi:hypothetical protein ASG94_16610 [Nocardioides sp. Soil805]|nr:hypothetical protein ASG94_16610 [Nocardioides sp. Soil805]